MPAQVDDEMTNKAKRQRESNSRSQSEERQPRLADVSSAKSVSSTLMAPAEAAALANLSRAIPVTEDLGDLGGEMLNASQTKELGKGQVPGKGSTVNGTEDFWSQSWKDEQKGKVQAKVKGKGKGKEEHAWQSRQKHSNWPSKSTKTAVVSVELLDLLLTQGLQSSRRLSDLEATSYYSHNIPTNSIMCTHIEDTYQGYLAKAKANPKEHNLGPPSIHRGIALLKVVMDWKDHLKAKDGLTHMWPVVQKALEELRMEETDLSDSQEIVGHCKIVPMFDKARTRLTFGFPIIVICGEKTHTLGSVVSRLIRAIGYDRMVGPAPDGYISRRFSETLATLREDDSW
jgi:hypothetical protein